MNWLLITPPVQDMRLWNTHIMPGGLFISGRDALEQTFAWLQTLNESIPITRKHWWWLHDGLWSLKLICEPLKLSNHKIKMGFTVMYSTPFSLLQSIQIILLYSFSGTQKKSSIYSNTRSSWKYCYRLMESCFWLQLHSHSHAVSKTLLEGMNSMQCKMSVKWSVRIYILLYRRIIP